MGWKLLLGNLCAVLIYVAPLEIMGFGAVGGAAVRFQAKLGFCFWIVPPKYQPLRLGNPKILLEMYTHVEAVAKAVIHDWKSPIQKVKGFLRTKTK